MSERPPTELSRRGFLGGSLVGLTAISHGSARAAPEAAPVSVEVNGAPLQVTTGDDDSVLTVLRDQIHLTGTKHACGSGACGACAVLVNGVPHLSCVLPAVAIDQQKVTTIEGVGGASIEQLHPVQRAFLAADAVQCGFCTPGFVVAAVAFHDRWRKGKGRAEPPREEIVSALSGHLCRCGAYEDIVRAVQSACRGEHDAVQVFPYRPDALAKVTGAARFTVDVALDGLVEAVIVRAPSAPARLRSLSMEKALDVPGVRYALRILADGARVLYAGQEVAVVAGVDRASAERGARAVTGDWEVLPAVTSMEAALAPGAPLVFPSTAESEAAPVSGRRLPATWERNLRGPVSGSLLARAGRARKALEGAREEGAVAEGVFRTSAQAHCAMEPHAAVARWIEDRLELWVSTESVQEVLARVSTEYRLAPGRCTVLSTFVGGGFGGKRGLGPEVRAAIDLAKILGVPVRVQLDRAEEIGLAARAATQTEVGLAIDAEGALTGLLSYSYSSAGAAIGNLCSQAARFVYDTPNKDLDDYDVVTNTSPAAPMRAPGGPPLFFALESAVDLAAERLNVDPIALRKRWDPHPARQLLYDRAAQLPLWTQRGQASDGRLRIGVGAAAAAWPAEWDPGAQVEVEIGPDGVVVRSGAQDAGEGTAAVLASVVAAGLGVSASGVRVDIGSSAFVYGPPTVDGRQASLVAAAERATARLREELADLAAEKGIPADPPWTRVVAGSPPVRAVGRRGRKPGELDWGPFAAAPDVASVVTLVQVAVDPRLGRVRVLRGWVGVGAGAVPALAVARSQVMSAFVQGVGLALTEDRRVDPLTGRILSRDLDDYLIPGIGDSAPVEVEFVTGGVDVRGGALDVGEVAGLAVPGAIANAVHAAIGRRPLRLPLSAPRVLELLQ